MKCELIEEQEIRSAKFHSLTGPIATRPLDKEQTVAVPELTCHRPSFTGN